MEAVGGEEARGGGWRLGGALLGEPDVPGRAELMEFTDDFFVDPGVFLDVEMVGAGFEEVSAIGADIHVDEIRGVLGFGLELDSAEKGEGVETVGLVDVVAEADVGGDLGGRDGIEGDDQVDGDVFFLEELGNAEGIVGAVGVADEDEGFRFFGVAVFLGDGGGELVPLVFLEDTGANAGGVDFLAEAVDAIGPDADEPAE